MLLFISVSRELFVTIQYIWIIVAVLVFLLLLKITAPYGRHTTHNWGPLISNKWGWLIMELPVLVMIGLFVVPALNNFAVASLIMIGLFSFHYFNRIFIFPFRIQTKGKKMPLVIMLSAILFNIINGFSFGYYFVHFAEYENAWLTEWRFIAGIIIFFAGMYINWKADNKLIHLRAPGETGYKIPRGWLFEKISCPNLFGELIEWLGFALLCWNLPALTFFIWTTANLVPRAFAHHKWYQEKFPDYPPGRKAIIPFFV